MRVIIREEAADELGSIFFRLERESRTAALELARRIRERIRRLETPGLSYMGRPGLVANTRELVEAPYIIVYQVNLRREEIEVIAIFHSKQSR